MSQENEEDALLVVCLITNAACHVHLHLHMHWKLCRDLMVATVPVQHRGMQLHTLLGMQAGDMSFAYICIHWRYLSSYTLKEVEFSGGPHL